MHIALKADKNKGSGLGQRFSTPCARIVGVSELVALLLFYTLTSAGARDAFLVHSMRDTFNKNP